MASRIRFFQVGLLIFLFQKVCSQVNSEHQTTTPYCDGFLTLNDKEPSYRIEVPSLPFGFGNRDSKCYWYFYAPPGDAIKLEVIDLAIGRNESLMVFDGGSSGVDIKQFLGDDFVSESNSLAIRLDSGLVFEGTAVLQLTLHKTKSKSVGILSSGPNQCGGSITLDQSTPSIELGATNQLAGSYPAYCTWHIMTPASTVATLRFLEVHLEFYDNFMVADSMGNRLAEFLSINSVPYEVVSDSNQILALFDAYDVQSSSYVRFEVFFNDTATVSDEAAIRPMSGGHISLTEELPSFAFRTNNFSTGSSVYFGGYWFIEAPTGSKISVEISDMDTGSGVYLDVRSGLNTPLASLSGNFALDPFLTLDNSAVIWLYSQWRDPGHGVTVNVSISDDIFGDPSVTRSSCGGSIALDQTRLPSLSFSSPNYGTSIDQYTVCYWYFTSPHNTLVQVEFTDIQTQNGYVYVFDSVNSPAVTVSSIAGEGALSPFHSSASGVSVLYNDMSEASNGRGLLARVSIIDATTPRPDTSCGGQIALYVSQSSAAVKTPWYNTPSSVLASTLCYWYITCETDQVISFHVADLQTLDASLTVYDAVNSLQKQLAIVKGDSVPLDFRSSGPGVTVVFSDYPSSYVERGFSAVASMSDPFTWDESTIMTSCGGSIEMFSTSTSLTFTTPSYPSLQPNGFFDCRWYFSGQDDMVYTLEILDLDTASTTYMYVFDEATAVTGSQVAELSGTDIATTVVGSKNALFARFYDSSTTDTARGLKAKITLSVPPNWDEYTTIPSCGGGIPLDFDNRKFLFTTPDYPDTFEDHFDCRWYVRSPSDTIVSIQFLDFNTDSNSYISLHDGSSISDTELFRASGSNYPASMNATGNNMALRFFSNRATTGRGASMIVTFLGGSRPTSDIRLVGGSGSHEGRVEFYHDHIWGTVCDDSWGVEDATVACRMLGYRTVISVWSRAYFGAGTGQIWLDDLQCSGDEKHLIDCTHAMPTGTNNCGHSEDAGVTCGEGDCNGSRTTSLWTTTTTKNLPPNPNLFLRGSCPGCKCPGVVVLNLKRGADVTCESNSMTVLVDRVLLAHGDGASDVHLADESCRGYDHDSVKVAISTSFDGCGTVMEETEDTITFSNIVTFFEPRSQHGETVTRDSILHIPVTCTFDRHVILSDSYRPHVGVVSFTETGFGNFSLELGQFSSASFAVRTAEETKIPLGEPVFFAVNLTAVTDVTLLIESCWATPHPYPFDQAKYPIITDGCAVDPTVIFYDDVLNNPLMSTFSVQAFGFVGEYDQVFMHCEVVICDNSDPSSRCTQGCTRNRKRRAAQVRGSSSKPHTISNGPISPQRERRKANGFGHAGKTPADNSSDDRNKMIAMGLSGILLAAGVMMAYVTFSKGQRRSRGYQKLRKEDVDDDDVVEA